MTGPPPSVPRDEPPAAAPEELPEQGPGPGPERVRTVHIARAVEHGRIEDLPIDKLLVNGRLSLYPGVAAGTYLRLAYGEGNTVAFAAKQFVGVIPLNPDVVVHVRPRVPVDSLARVLRIADVVPGELKQLVRGYEADDESLPAIVDLLAAAFVAAVRDVVGQGLLRSHRPRTQETSFPRGRLLAGRTTALHARGQRSRVAVTWTEPDADTAPNRLLKYVLSSLAGVYARGRRAKKGALGLLFGINRLYPYFRGVPLDARRTFLADPFLVRPETLPYSRAYYAPAVRLGLLLAREHSLRLSGAEGPIPLAPLVLDLEVAFEAYLRNTLRAEFARHAPECVALDGNADGAKMLFDEPVTTNAANPDIVVRRRESGTAPLLVEVKYKPYETAIDRDDLNQVIAYAASYRAPVSVIVHPRTEAGPAGLREIGAVGPHRLLAYAYDLRIVPLEREEEAFAEHIRRLVPGAVTELATGAS